MRRLVRARRPEHQWLRTASRGSKTSKRNKARTSRDIRCSLWGAQGRGAGLFPDISTKKKKDEATIVTLARRARPPSVSTVILGSILRGTGNLKRANCSATALTQHDKARRHASLSRGGVASTNGRPTHTWNDLPTGCMRGGMGRNRGGPPC